MRKRTCCLLAGFLILFSCSQQANGQSILPKGESHGFKNYVSVPVAGNCWVNSSGEDTDEIVSDEGIRGWKDGQTTFCFYFRTGHTGKISLAFRARTPSGSSICKFILGDEVKMSTVSNNSFDTIKIGSFNLKHTGYQKVTLTGKPGSKGSLPQISDLLILCDDPKMQLSCVKDDFYWGRRGPSVHLNYPVPEQAGDVLWFYNEITVPGGNDVTGSYFMATGFKEGYFGIQVNSPSERRVLFSVWSPAKTDHPDEIPAEEKIILLKKGKDVHAGNFGDEGSGGQSYLVYPWKAETKYSFLINGKPSDNNSTDYTAYFFDPQKGCWELIAGFRRPKTTTYLTHLHSFLENFLPETGNISRTGLFSNQWICNSKGEWTELRKARFTADATARKGSRTDYSGGVINNLFFLKNCGFFNETTAMDTWFTRPLSGNSPTIDLQNLPQF